MINAFHFAWRGALAADALAMPVHWYYDCAALLRDYGRVERYLAPKNPHPDSILWRSTYVAASPQTDILHDQAKYWGERGVHYHQFLCAGENTLNFQLATELVRWMQGRRVYNVEEWAAHYVSVMTTPNWHRDTYVEEYHRAFFTNVAKGKKLLRCGIEDEHIGGLVPVSALLCAVPEANREEHEQLVRTHVGLTHWHDGVQHAARILVRLLHALQTMSLEEALVVEANDFFSLRRAHEWAAQPDEVVIGRVLSPACYIKDAFPAALYLAWKYRDNPREGFIANAMVGGDSCHRGAVVGAVLGMSAGVEFDFTNVQNAEGAEGSVLDS